MYKFVIISAFITGTLSMNFDSNCLAVCKEKPIGYKLPDPTDCLGYILCHKDFVLQQYCESGTKFDENRQQCVVGKCPPCMCNCNSCGNSSSTQITPSTPSTTTPSDHNSPDCSLYPNGTLLPHSEHCRFFWTCLHSKAILSFCELGMWYDRVHFVCNYPEMVNCPANRD